MIYDDFANATYFRKLFKRQNLAVDAEITYAFSNSLEDDWNSTAFSSYTLYDVYNNGYYYGGKLNVTLDREVYCNEEECFVNKYLSKLHLRNKYGNRNTLHDATLRLTVVVSTMSIKLSEILSSIYLQVTKVPITSPPEEIFAFLRSVNGTNYDAIARFGFQALSILVEVLGCK